MTALLPLVHVVLCVFVMRAHVGVGEAAWDDGMLVLADVGCGYCLMWPSYTGVLDLIAWDTGGLDAAARGRGRVLICCNLFRLNPYDPILSHLCIGELSYFPAL